MLFPKAKRIGLEQDWYKTKDAVFGPYKGYMFTVGDASLLSNPQAKNVIASTGNLTDEQKEIIRAELKAQKKALKFTSAEITDNSVFVQFVEVWKYTKVQTVYNLLDFLVELFERLELPHTEKCNNCSTAGNLGYYDLSNAGVLLCRSCFHDTETELYDMEREQLLEEKNYLTGFVGSLLFSVPGIIAWVLVAVYLDTIASALAMGIAFLGLKGYIWFKGKMGNVTPYLIILSNILCIVVANYATAGFLLYDEGLDFSTIMNVLQANEEIQSLIFSNTMISFVLAFFIWIWLLSQLKKEPLQIKPAAKVNDKVLATA